MSSADNYASLRERLLDGDMAVEEKKLLERLTEGDEMTEEQNQKANISFISADNLVIVQYESGNPEDYQHACTVQHKLMNMGRKVVIAPDNITVAEAIVRKPIS